MSGKLVLAATPIGNLGDATPRVGELLRAADAVYCEDTRQTRKLLQHFQVKRELTAFHEHSAASVLERIAVQLNNGQTVLYTSDAGMPGISDPGYELVNLAYELDCEVDVLPGPSAVINALVLSGLPNHAFCFMGFFPSKREKQRELIEKLAAVKMTSIHFESPNRINHTLSFLAEAVPETDVAICREMTKRHQEVLRGKPADVAQKLDTIKGEFVLVIGPVAETESESSPEEAYKALLAEGHTPNQSLKLTAKRFRISKRDLYRQIHGIEND